MVPDHILMELIYLCPFWLQIVKTRKLKYRNLVNTFSFCEWLIHFISQVSSAVLVNLCIDDGWVYLDLESLDLSSDLIVNLCINVAWVYLDGESIDVGIDLLSCCQHLIPKIYFCDLRWKNSIDWWEILVELHDWFFTYLWSKHLKFASSFFQTQTPRWPDK